jgi:hypothetical protein
MVSRESSLAHELYFLYELAKVLTSSIDLAEVTELVLDGGCALLGTEQGFLFWLEGEKLRCQVSRGLDADDLDTLARAVGPILATRRPLAVAHPRAAGGEVVAAPLIVRGQAQGVIGVTSAQARRFVPVEQERLASVAYLAGLALENARMYERSQREVTVLLDLVQTAHLMESGQLSREQAVALEQIEAGDELGRFRQAFGKMAQQVMEREEVLRRQVAQMRIEIDAVKRDRQVSEIVESEYFQVLRVRAQQIRSRRD